MELKIIDCDFSVCRVKRFTPEILNSDFFFTGRTDEENSLVCPTASVPADAVFREDGWRAFRISGVLDFSLIGILSRISSVLADNGIGIFAVSTYNTDYIFTKNENFRRALELLEQAGYSVRR